MESTQHCPDFVKDMNAVLKHHNCEWLNGTPPDYSLSNQLYLEGKSVLYNYDEVDCDSINSYRTFKDS